MFDPYQVILEERQPAVLFPESAAPTDLFLQLVYGLETVFACQPSVLYTPGASALTLLYRDAAFLWQDLSESLGPLIAALSDQWPLICYGTTQARETAELSIRREGKQQVTRLRSLSGRPLDSLHSLGLRLELGNGEAAAQLAEMAACVSPLRPCIAVSRKHDAFLRDCGLLASTGGSLYCHLVWGTAPPSVRLDALSSAQKVHLWQTFLLDQAQPLEFSWLWDAYYTEAVPLLEWELALRAVLDALGYRVEREETVFRVTDAQGKERRFDFIRGGPAEKLFLKLLFPLDAK